MTAVVQWQDTGLGRKPAAGGAPDSEVPVRIGSAPLRGSARDELADDARPWRRSTNPPTMLPWSNGRMAVCPTVGPRASRGGGVVGKVSVPHPTNYLSHKCRS